MLIPIEGEDFVKIFLSIDEGFKLVHDCLEC